MAHTYYLAKTDPETYSVEQFERDKRTIWDGVRNPQAVQAMRAMKKDDLIFIYHSMGNPAVVGLAKALGPARPDPKDAKLAVIDLEFVTRLDPPVTLHEIKQSKLFDDWALVRQSRLSTMAAPAAFADWMDKRYRKAGIRIL